MSADTTAVDTAAQEAREETPFIEYDGERYAIVRKPSVLLLAELARTDSDDPGAMAVIADFFESTLGDGYPKFRRACYRNSADYPTLMGLMGEVIMAASGRPTK